MKTGRSVHSEIIKIVMVGTVRFQRRVFRGGIGLLPLAREINLKRMDSITLKNCDVPSASVLATAEQTTKRHVPTLLSIEEHIHIDVVCVCSFAYFSRVSGTVSLVAFDLVLCRAFSVNVS